MNTKNELIQRLNAVVKALDTVTVSGKPNLNSILGSINVLEGCIVLIRNDDSLEDNLNDTEVN